MVISLVLDMNDGRVHPAEFSADEYRFIHYAVDRFAAFSNITWDLGDDLDGYRNRWWPRITGTLIKKWDPYHHLATSHPMNNVNQDRASDWLDFTSFQEWSRKQHAFMLSQRKEQEKLGRVIPQTNEEYGYEDHYPLWAPQPDSESADALRRTAWDIVMAGGYQTHRRDCAARYKYLAGHRRWLDERPCRRHHDHASRYGHMVDFFTSFEWWKTEPHDELVNNGNYCLAEPGKIYAIYLPRGGKATVQLQKGPYSGAWFDPSTGEKIPIPLAEGPVWTSALAPSNNDWSLFLQRK